MGRFVDRLVHSNDGALLQILHSPKIAREDKVGILMMRLAHFVLLVSAMLTFASCLGTFSTTRIGETDTNGNLIFHRWESEGHKGHAILKKGYGMMVFYDSRHPEKPPRFELYIHKGSVIIQTTDLDQFKKELRRVPPGAILHFYNTCAGGTHHGLARSIISEILDF